MRDTMNALRLVAAAMMLFGSNACVVTTEDLRELKEEAAACEAGDTCVLAGAGNCACASPVNQQRAEEVDALAKRVACYGVMVDCIGHENLRCESGRCTGDELL